MTMVINKYKNRHHKNKRKTRITKAAKMKRLKFLGGSLIAGIVIFSCLFLFTNTYSGLGSKGILKTNNYNYDKLYKERGILKYEDKNFTSKIGIDVSGYQQDIDWDKVKKEGIDFAIIRVGYSGWHNGKIVEDDYFERNIKHANKAGVKVGVYFFSQAITPREAIDEAEFVLKKIISKNVEYPVVFDMEPIDGTERTFELTSKEKTEIAYAFCKVIEKYGYTPMIYGNPLWLENQLDLEYLSGYNLWLAHYNDFSNFPYHHKLWQYTQEGTVKGVKGYVDMNIEFIEK